jgi:hypothetical protein
MNDALDRLRAADPARSTTEPDPHSPQALALLERVFTAPAPPVRRRRLVIGVAGATVVAAAAAAFFVAEPAAAYTVDKHADGSVGLSFRAARLKDTVRLNAELARADAHTVVVRMVPADRCSEPLDIHPDFPFRTYATPEEVDRYPVSYRLQDETVIITIRPDKIPNGATLAFGYATPDRHTTVAVPAVVRTMPSCMAIPTPPRR